jgi:hypothetical protein
MEDWKVITIQAIIQPSNLSSFHSSNFPTPNPAEPEPKGFAQKLAILLFGKPTCFVQYLMREIQVTERFSRHGVENFPQ